MKAAKWYVWLAGGNKKELEEGKRYKITKNN